MRTLRGTFTLKNGLQLQAFWQVSYTHASYYEPEEYGDIDPEHPDSLLLDGCACELEDLPRGLAAVIPNLPLEVV